ncbi:MAG: recombination protein RecR [Acholeplasmatales bacterium]|nr:MAG: recombination protein RecR [Acholeplasmatales bacterium]
MRYPEALDRLIEQFRRFPGIGQKTAERYALFLIDQFSEEDIVAFMETLHRVKSEIAPCTQCGHLTDIQPCTLCRDDRRKTTTMLVVEDSRDVIVIERAGLYDGQYHVLGGTLAPSRGIGPEDLRIKPLLERLKDDRFEEVILAMNLSDEGETTAMYLNRLLEGTDLLVTRIAHGMPAGGNIGYADEVTLFKSLEGRKKY